MPVLRRTKIKGDNIANRTITAEKIKQDTLTSTEIGDNAIGSSELATNAVGSVHISNNTIYNNHIVDGEVFWSKIGGTVLKYVSIGTTETAVDTGLPSVSAFFLTLWDARGVAQTKDPSGGTIYLIADTAGSVDIYAIR